VNVFPSPAFGLHRYGWETSTGELVALLAREERAKREQRLARRQDARGKVERGERVFHCLFVIATHDAAYNTSWIFSELDDASPCDLNDHAVVCKGFRGVSCGLSVSNTGDEPHALLRLLSERYDEAVRHAAGM